MVIFNSNVSHNQRENHHQIPLIPHFHMVFLWFSYGFPMVYRCVQQWLNGSLRGHGGHRLRGLRMVQEDVSAEAAAPEQGSKRATCHATEP